MKAAAKFYHIFVLGFYLFVLYSINLNNHKKLPEEIEVINNMRRFSGRFLTNWTFGLQTIYFAGCMLAHFMDLIPGCQPVKEKVNKMSNFLFTAIATPMALMVTLVFWSIYIIDRELIFPKVIDLVMPPWINHSIHTLNTLLALGDMYFVYHKYPSWKNASQGLLCYLVPYGFCLFGTYWQTGLWLYPFLGKLTWTLRVIAALLTFVGALFVFGMTKLANNIVWGSLPVSSSAKKPNKRKLKK